MSDLQRKPDYPLEQGVDGQRGGLTELAGGIPAEEIMRGGMRLDGEYEAYMRWRIRQTLHGGEIIPRGPEF